MLTVSLFQVVGRDGTENPQTRMTAISCRRRTNFLYAESSPRFNHAAGRQGSRSRPADREKNGVRAPVGRARFATSSIAKQPSFISPSFGRAWGLPVSFPIPPNEGVWRARADAEEENAPVQRATGFSRFRVPRCPDQGRPLVAGGVYPGSARGCSCEPHPRVPVPPHLHDAS